MGCNHPLVGKNLADDYFFFNSSIVSFIIVIIKRIRYNVKKSIIPPPFSDWKRSDRLL